jgi:hypothetical protein
VTALNKMETKSFGAIPLSDKWSGYYLTDIEKVGIAALALGTTNPEAIKSLIGLKKNNVRTLLRILEDAEWNMHVAIGYVSHDRQGNMVYNQEAYPILRMKGVAA